MVAGCFMILSVAQKASGDDRVVVFGDSWGVFSALALQQTFDDLVPEAGASVLNSATFGSEASEWNTLSQLNEITSILNDHSSADLVHVSLGGNDLTADWNANLPAAAEDALLDRIADDIEAVVTHIVAQDPNIEVFYSSYTYLGPLDLGTPLEVNTVLEELHSRVEDRLASIPQATTGNYYGLTQTIYGQSEFNLPPGDPSLPDINLPGAPEAFFPFDPIHLTPSIFGGTGAYNDLAEAQYSDFYQSRLTITGIPEPSSLLLGAFASVGVLVRRRRRA